MTDTADRKSEPWFACVGINAFRYELFTVLIEAGDQVIFFEREALVPAWTDICDSRQVELGAAVLESNVVSPGYFDADARYVTRRHPQKLRKRGGEGPLIHARAFHELGTHRAGTQQCHGDTAAREFAAQPFGVRLYERLGGAVADLPGEWVEARGGSDVENPAASTCHHLLDGAGREIDDGLHVHPCLRYLSVCGGLGH